ncbi:tRNA-specific adenosine deaminase [Bdellovibrio sp. qaytius]|nr:tRNA-specific adenosine deaminase [Bdellovibrio sp. qaytius]
MTNEYMKRAIELSKNNISHGGGPFGAVIVKDGKIIGEGFNKVTANNDPTAHAEVEAIREACKNISNFDLSGAEIYTSCEPCPMCLSAIYWARLGKVYYANTKKDAAAIEFDDDFIYTEIPKPLEQRKISMVQMMRPEALEVFKAWQTSAVKIKY